MVRVLEKILVLTTARRNKDYRENKEIKAGNLIVTCFFYKMLRLC